MKIDFRLAAGGRGCATVCGGGTALLFAVGSFSFLGSADDELDALIACGVCAVAPFPFAGLFRMLVD